MYSSQLFGLGVSTIEPSSRRATSFPPGSSPSSRAIAAGIVICRLDEIVTLAAEG